MKIRKAWYGVYGPLWVAFYALFWAACGIGVTLEKVEGWAK